MKNYIAIDIGASSGRLISGHLENGRLLTREVYRFGNGSHVGASGRLCWDLDRIFGEIIVGLRKAASEEKIDFIGIDTWGVDFVLLDRGGKPLGEAVCYRDSRTEGSGRILAEKVGMKRMYHLTGIQENRINTINQLMSIKETEPELLEGAERLLFIPDYLGYLLTGRFSCEYTNASTSGLLNAESGVWDREIIRKLGLPPHIFRQLRRPCMTLGPLSDAIAKEIGCDALVLLPATHDTGSAVFALPSDDENPLYISSGTWSLLGTELDAPILTEQARKANFTNEGGAGGSIRFLKNIMGLWMIQSVRAEKSLSFDEIERAARRSLGTKLRVDVNDGRFLAPKSMTAEIEAAVGKKTDDSELFAVIYLSLADYYKKAVDELCEIIGKALPDTLNIIGGGSRDALLCELTASACGKRVLAGPAEATAIGNLCAQMTATGEITDKRAARRIVADSFEIKEYLPEEKRSF